MARGRAALGLVAGAAAAVFGTRLLGAALICLAPSSDTFSDDFNRADGPVGNGWTAYNAGASIENGQLATVGGNVDAGGVYRALHVEPPFEFSFTHRGGSSQNALVLNVNSDDTEEAGGTPATGMWYMLLDWTGTFPGQVTILSNGVNRGSQTFSFTPVSGDVLSIQGAVAADLSSEITLSVNGGPPETLSFPAISDPGDGGNLLLGNASSVPGPHFFDDFVITSVSSDSDEDGLTDSDETGVHGTDPQDPDTDDDGLLDGTEVDMAQGSGCPSPLHADSDGDGLSDGAEVYVSFTDPCSADTDGDGVLDGEDPTPLVPGVTTSWLEEASGDLATNVDGILLSLFTGPNDNANAGRRNSIANRLRNAAKAFASGDLSGAIDLLQGVLERVDGIEPATDWMYDSPEKADLAADLMLLIELAQLGE